MHEPREEHREERDENLACPLAFSEELVPRDPISFRATRF